MAKVKKKRFGAIFYNSKHNTENSEKQFYCLRLGISWERSQFKQNDHSACYIN